LATITNVPEVDISAKAILVESQGEMDENVILDGYNTSPDNKTPSKYADNVTVSESFGRASTDTIRALETNCSE
jgi:hypothetical protein